AAPAVPVARAVVELRIGLGVFEAAEPLFHETHGAIEKEAVHGADVDAELAGELGAQARPVAREDVAEVVVIAPVRRDLAVDRAGALVPDAPRIAVGADGRVDRLPDVVLLARSRARPQHQLEKVVLLHGAAGEPVVGSRGGAGRAAERPRR